MWEYKMWSMIYIGQINCRKWAVLFSQIHHYTNLYDYIPEMHLHTQNYAAIFNKMFLRTAVETLTVVNCRKEYSNSPTHIVFRFKKVHCINRMKIYIYIYMVKCTFKVQRVLSEQNLLGTCCYDKCSGLYRFN